LSEEASRFAWRGGRVPVRSNEAGWGFGAHEARFGSGRGCTGCRSGSAGGVCLTVHATVVKPQYVASIGGGLGGHAQIYPGGVDVDQSGNVYVSDTGNDSIRAYSADGTPLWGGPKGVRGAHALGAFDNPRDIAYLNGRLYVADLGNKRVQVLDALTGNPISPQPGSWASDVFPSPIGISACIDGSGNPIILVSQDVKNQVTAYTPSGVATGAHFGTGTAGSALNQLKAPRDAATDSAGNVYVADYGNDRIVKFNPTGNEITHWGGTGNHAGESSSQRRCSSSCAWWPAARGGECVRPCPCSKHQSR
jgi:DNA-binding beta-propeller fold protein YncE